MLLSTTQNPAGTRKVSQVEGIIAECKLAEAHTSRKD